MATDPFGDFRSRRGSLFDEFFSEFFDRPFGIEGATSPTGARTSAPPARRAVEQVDITQFFSDATRELLQRAAQRAIDWGSLDLDTEHLLWAAMQDDLVAQIVRHADGDPAAIAAQIEAGTMGRPVDFGQVAAFLCSDPARFITGAALQVDGGVYAGLL